MADATGDAPTDAAIDAPTDAAIDAPPDAALPQLVASTDAIDFGAVKIGYDATYALQVQNQGTVTALVTVTTIGDRAIFDSGGCAVQPMQTCTIILHFLTYATGERMATITLKSGAWQHVVTARGESATTLHLTKWGNGGMTLPSLSCPIGCDTTFAKDVVVTAVPSSGNQFVAWSDPTCGTQLTCTVHQDAIGRYLRAYFAPTSSAMLTVSVTGGSVRVETGSFSYSEIATCTGPCAVPIPVGASIRVTAKSLGDVVTISGACSGVATCTFTSAGSTSVAVAIQHDAKELWARELEAPTVLSADYDSQGNLIVVTDGYSPTSGPSTTGDVIKLDSMGRTIWMHPNQAGQELRVGAYDSVFVRSGNTAWVLDSAGYTLGALTWSDVEPSTYRFPYYPRRFDITTADQRVMVGDPASNVTNVRSSLAMWTTMISAVSLNVLRATTTRIFAAIANSNGGFDLAVLDHTGAVLTPITDVAPHPGNFDILPGGDIVSASSTASEIAIRRKAASTTVFTRTVPIQYTEAPYVAATSASSDRVFWVGPARAQAIAAVNGYYAEILTPQGAPEWTLGRTSPVEVYDMTGNASDVALVGAYTGAASSAGGSSTNGVVFGAGFVQTFRP